MRAKVVRQLSRQPNRPLSNGQVAALLYVATRTASKWIDSGRIKGYRLPGSEDRRVFPADLREFLLRDGYAVPAELAGPASVSYGLLDGEAVEGLTGCRTLVELGGVLERSVVGRAVVGDGDGTAACREAVEALKGRNPDCRVVLVLSGDADAGRCGAAAADRVFRRPCDWGEVAAALAGKVVTP